MSFKGITRFVKSKYQDNSEKLDWVGVLISEMMFGPLKDSFILWSMSMYSVQNMVESGFSFVFIVKKEGMTFHVE